MRDSTPSISNRPPPDDLVRHVAWCAVSGTTLRQMVPPGWRPTTCDFLSKAPLARLSSEPFAVVLDDWTSNLADRIGGFWGPARKAVNLFLRDATYNVWLRQDFNLAAHEHDMEIPLDGIIMRAIRNETNDKALRVTAVKHLTPDDSGLYQNAAGAIAAQRGFPRVHLDVVWWTETTTSAQE